MATLESEPGSIFQFARWMSATTKERTTAAKALAKSLGSQWNFRGLRKFFGVRSRQEIARFSFDDEHLTQQPEFSETQLRAELAAESEADQVLRSL